MLGRVFLLALATSGLAANICGQVGKHDQNKISHYMGNFFWKGPTTFALCALYYKKDAPKCKSFQYSYFSDATGQYCEFSKMHCKCSPPASLLRSRESIDAILEKASPMWITANRITTTTSAALFLLTLMYRRQLSQTESEPQPSRKCSSKWRRSFARRPIRLLP